MRESAIIDPSQFETAASERRFMLAFLDSVYRRSTGELVHLIFDEADLWAPERILDKEGEATKPAVPLARNEAITVVLDLVDPFRAHRRLGPSEANRTQRRQRLTLWSIVIAVFAILWSIIAKVASLL
jgi:hypothetical protein